MIDSAMLITMRIEMIDSTMLIEMIDSAMLIAMRVDIYLINYYNNA